MPLLIIPFLLLFILGMVVLLIPVSILQRYRNGTARRRARGWIAVLNVVLIMVSSVTFLVTAAVSSTWLTGAFRNALLGIGGGCLLGVAGLMLTRWEDASRELYFTPNRWLVLALTMAIAVRLGFGLWRAWHAWHWTPVGESWAAASGLAQTMVVGAVVLGYYLMYWAGVWIRYRRHQVLLKQG